RRLDGCPHIGGKVRAKFADVQRSGILRLNRGLIIVNRGDHDDLGFRRDVAGVAKHLHAADARHANVGHHDIVKRAIELVISLLAGSHGLDVMTIVPQRDLQHGADGAFIVANEYVAHTSFLYSFQASAWSKAGVASTGSSARRKLK